MSLLIRNIKTLFQVRESPLKWVAGADMQDLPHMDHAYLLIQDGLIHDYGLMDNLPELNPEQVVDADDRLVLPAFVDSHTHLVFAESRESEFVDRINGLSYEEIARRGGGILNSAKKLQEVPEEILFEKTMERATDLIKWGTGAVEIKSGYGLTVRDELKMLRVARRVGIESPLLVKTTFLGAHAVPPSCSNKKDYINLVIDEMLPAVSEEGLADYCDVFCEEGFFSQEETEQILKAAIDYGLKPKVHANQLHRSGGVQAGVNTGAISVDHLECMGDEEIECLLESDTMPTFLPGAAFFLNSEFPPARRMIERGLPVAIASDYNPGSSPVGRMSFIISLACIKMKMTPEEAINAATINTAFAMDVLDQAGTITRGKAAHLIITKKIPSLAYIPYAFGENVIDKVILSGSVVDS